VFGKLGPAFEAVLPLDDKLRVGQSKLRALQLQVRKPAESWVIFLNALQNMLKRMRVVRIDSFEKVLGLNFLSSLCLESALVRLKEGS